MIADLIIRLAVGAVICWLMLAAMRFGDQTDPMDPAWRAAHNAVKGTPDEEWLRRQHLLVDKDAPW